MGISYSTYVVVGFDASAVITIHKKIVSQTKYNEDTGIPYTAETTKEKRYLGRIEIPKEASLEDVVSTVIPDMETYQADHEDERGKVIIGIAIKTLDKPCVSELKTTDIESIRQKVKIQARSNLGVDIEPRVFVVFHCSY